MKKILCVLLATLMVLSMVALTACGKAEEKLKFGVGIVNTVSKATDADGDVDGAGEAVSTIAAVLVDKDGKIVKCVIDTSDSTVNYTSAGVAVPKEGFKTKYELGNDYGMSKLGVKEWYEQIDILCDVVAGKTISEVKAMVVDGKGSDEIVNAGCTITISGYVAALEKAVSAAVDSEATKNDALKIGVDVEQSCKDATEEKNGSNQLETTIVVSAVNSDGKVVATYADCVQVKFTFDTAGVSMFDKSAAVKSKKELGNDYGMSKLGVKEWYEQAEAFENACIGKTAGEISGLEGDGGKGVEALQTAGCTIGVTELVKAAVKAAK